LYPFHPISVLITGDYLAIFFKTAYKASPSSLSRAPYPTRIIGNLALAILAAKG
jgi:hypothetical protein